MTSHVSQFFVGNAFGEKILQNFPTLHTSNTCSALLRKKIVLQENSFKDKAPEKDWAGAGLRGLPRERK